VTTAVDTDEAVALRGVMRRFVDDELMPLEREVMSRGLRYGATVEPLIPPTDHDRLIRRTRELDVFGIDVPAEFGGHGFGATM
jgi:(R)-benzylsuccinyl-CoA dehydrogenase